MIPRSNSNALALASMSRYLAQNANVLFTACGACQNNDKLAKAVFALLFGKEKNLTLLMNGANTALRTITGKIRLNQSLNEKKVQWKPWTIIDKSGPRPLQNNRGNWLAPGLGDGGFLFFNASNSDAANSGRRNVDGPYHPHKFRGKE